MWGLRLVKFQYLVGPVQQVYELLTSLVLLQGRNPAVPAGLFLDPGLLDSDA
jgi:hypothetical protein